MRVLVDMNLSGKWVDFLLGAGHEATHWAMIGSADAPDQEILQYAKSHSWLVLTNDLDFGIMLAHSGDRDPTVVQLRADDLRVHVIGTAVLAALAQTGEAGASALVTVESQRTRVRLLPFPKHRDSQP